MRTQIDHGIAWDPIIVKVEVNPINERVLTQEDMDRVWPGQKLPTEFRRTKGGIKEWQK